MRLKIAPMRAEWAEEIGAWRYPGELSAYDLMGDTAELMEGGYLAALDEERLVGFYCYGAPARVPGYGYGEQALDMGLGLHPALVRQGHGRRFVARGIEYLEQRFPGRPLRLTVAQFNRPAIRVYAGLGFELLDRFEAPGGHPFWVMQRGGTSYLDITPALDARTPVYPGDPPVCLSPLATLDDAGYRLTGVRLSSHAGAHLDAPAHYLEAGASLDEVDIRLLNGFAQLIHTPSGPVGPEALAQLLPGARRVLLRTDGSEGLTLEGAQWLTDHGVGLVGIDRLSIAQGSLEAPVHRALLEAGVWILEGLALGRAQPGGWQLHCLPLKLADAEAAPVRALLSDWIDVGEMS